MRLPDPIEQAIRDIESEWAQRPGQKAGTPRARDLRWAIEDMMRTCGVTYRHWKECYDGLRSEQVSRGNEPDV